MLSFAEVKDILDDIEYKDWEKEIIPVDSNITLFRWQWYENEGPEQGLQKARLWVIEHRQPHSDIVRSALASVLMAEEHEARERIRYRGKKVFNPHYNVDRLAEMAGKLENLEIPEPV